MKDNLRTTIGLEIHVQLATKSKMFCRCDNNAEGKAPNSVVCPVCLGMPGSLPVTNKQAVEWTMKTGLALNCQIPKIAKFDRKHYFYPDLPKDYQISQYDEPFCLGGYLEINDAVISNDSEKSYEISRLDKSMGRNDTLIKIRLNRVHLEEDAGKLIHSNGKSLVDLNRAGTPLMEIVTEPDIKSPEEAGEFLRKLQRIVRDEVQVSEASMEKGHLRCDANISVSDNNGKMSPIVELKNINSFKFVEKALTLVEAKLKDEYLEWPEGNTKETWGYDSKKNEVYLQRKKEEAADYRYFPEPDLPPIDTTEFDLDEIKGQFGESIEKKIEKYEEIGLTRGEANTLASNRTKEELFKAISQNSSLLLKVGKFVVHYNYDFNEGDIERAVEYAKAITASKENKISSNLFAAITKSIHLGESFDRSLEKVGGEQITDESAIGETIEEVLKNNPAEVAAYKQGKTALLGFFIGQIMKATEGKADPKIIHKLLQEKLK